MTPHRRQILSILFGIITIGVLAGIKQINSTVEVDEAEWLLFTGLILLTTIFGIPLGGGEVSMLPMTSLAAMMVMGVIPTGWAAVTSAIVHGVYRFFRGKRSQDEDKSFLLTNLGTTLANVSMHTTCILLSGFVYIHLGGEFPIAKPTNHTILGLYGTGAIYIFANYIIASLFISLRGKGYLSNYIHHIPNLLIYEIPPIIFAPLTAQIFTQLGIIQFGAFAISLVVISIILRDMANTHRHLERRVKELDSLQTIGQALSASLDIHVIAEAIYSEVKKLMPATNFYLALYDKTTNEVSFPLVYEFDERKNWRSRVAINGLTEYILRTKAPLLIQTNASERIEELGLKYMGLEAQSWLGVPILAGEESLGVIAVQSLVSPDAIPETYDSSHQEILVTIAAHASAAIQNAHLFTQTDEKLAQRVQELDSIFSTTKEGLLLVDSNLKVLATNRGLADFLGVTQASLSGINLQLSDPNIPFSLLESIGYTQEDLSKTIHRLTEEGGTSRGTFFTTDETQRCLERVAAPVLDEDRNVTGWLFVFRDLTEEFQLAQMKEDLTHMLVHDLRSPIINIRGGLDMINLMLQTDDKEDLEEMIQIAIRGSDEILDMINELLDISKFESGEMPLNKMPTNLVQIYQEVHDRISILAMQYGIQIKSEFSSDLPIVNCDPGLIRRTIHNILDNAIKFSPDNMPIEIIAKPDEEVKGSVIFMVSDRGEGIPEEEQKSIFLKYKTGSASCQARRKGTGIGLYFCKLVVDAHSGKIWVESEPGKGSTFCFRLPIRA
jgi:signal transduction histidine kinase